MSKVDRSLSAGLDSPHIRFFYRNWKGECNYRNVKGVPMWWYGESPYHKGAQWFIRAHDVDKDDIRDFAVVDIIEFCK